MKFVELQRPFGTLQAPLSPAEIDRLCLGAFGQASTTQARVCSGRFNTTYRMTLADGRQVILRVAPPADVRLFSHERFLLRREHAIQAQLAAAVAEAPQVLFADFSHTLIPRDYVFQACLDGQLWDELREQLTPAQNESLWAQLGDRVRAIHAIEGDRFGAPEPMVAADCWSGAVLADIEGLAGDIRGLGLSVALLEPFLALARDAAPALDQVKTPRLVHGDLWPKNVLIRLADEGPRITGVIDAERARWGDPGAEWIFGFLDIPSVFWQRYGRNLSTPALEAEAMLRRLVYNGRGALQLILDAWRFDLDDGFARRMLQEAVVNLASRLVACPG